MSTTTRVIPIHPLTEGRDGKIQARSVLGSFARWRWAMVWLTQLVYYGLPWLTLNGRQALLFDLEARRFHLFGAVLYPQDLIYLTGLLVISALLLFFVTAVAGRFWCGFACPQTVYTSVFMWVENRLEGSRQNRLRLDASGWTLEKCWRRGGKHLAWAAIALWTGFTLVGYFTPIREWGQQALLGSPGPWESFWTGFYGLATYVNAGLVREKVCLHMCPYGRFQGSLMDAETLNVAYDHRRGEPRQRHVRNGGLAARSGGSCIDCTLCVQVCPTGIDIRKGLQAACIGCGLCIDACNDVMDRISQPRGLIRLASLSELAAPIGQSARGWRELLRPRLLVYGLLLGGASAALALGFAWRPEWRLTVIRDRAVMARQVERGEVENVYRIQVMNASAGTRQVTLRLSGAEGMRIASATTLEVAAAQAATVPVTVRMAAPLASVQAGHVVPLPFEVADALAPHTSLARAESTFIVPR